jgi:ABC-type branched-subunit amino acid transport system substrate-binding protein
MRLKWLKQLSLLAVVAMLAAACSSGGGQAADESEPAEESEAATEETSEEASEEESDAPAVEGDGTLAIGTLLPQTGNLAFLGPPEFAGVDLAVQEINEAGGVLGQDVTVSDSDSGDTTTDIASQSVQRLLGEGVDAIVGAASSGVSLTVIDAITSAGVVQFSPANTAPDFTTYEDNDLYFRTAPSDVLQGQILAEVIVEDGATNVGIMALQDPYGEGLAGFLTESLEASGATIAGDPIIYDSAAPNYDTQVQDMLSRNPDAIAVIGFDESGRILQSFINAGSGPGEIPLYGTDGNMGNALGEQFTEPGAIEGFRGTTPLVELSQDFQDQLLELDPNLVDFNYAAESYDAVNIIALAATIAESDAGEALAEEIIDVTREGTECTDFASCLELVEAGEDIDYNGVSGPVEMDDVGDPTQASFGVLTFGADNRIDNAQTEYRLASL